MRYRRILPGVLFVVLGWAPRADAAPIIPTLTFGCVVDCSVVNQGSTFELIIRMNDIPDYDPTDASVVGLASFSFALLFDPSVVRVNNLSDITYGGFFGPLDPTIHFFPPCDPNPDPALPPPPPCDLSPPLFIGGSIDFPSLGVTGSGDLAKIVFEAWGFGDAGIAFLFNTCDPLDPFCDTPFNPLFFNGVDRDPIALNLVDGEVIVESTVPVPEPATIGLLGLGLLGLARRFL